MLGGIIIFISYSFYLQEGRVQEVSESARAQRTSAVPIPV